MYEAGHKREKIQLIISNYASKEANNPSISLRFLKRKETPHISPYAKPN